MEQTKYDVFISYSRKDYVDEQMNVIPGNEVSKIKDALANAGISYWFDEDCICSGDKFTDKIVANIDASPIFLFLATKNSCNSPWTSKEIACADELDKFIIPVRIDDTPYNKKVMFRIADLSYVDYGKNPEKGLNDLVNAITDHLNLLKDMTNPVVSYEKPSDTKGMVFFNILQTYIVNKQTLNIRYKSYKSSDISDFVVFPHLLKESRKRWYLIVSKLNDSEPLILSLDRIVSLEINNDIPYCDNEQIDFQHYFDDVIGVSKNFREKAVDVLFWVSNYRLQYIESKTLHASQRKIKKLADGCVFCIHVVVNFELYSTLMSYGSDLIVLSPQKAVKWISGEFEKTARLYKEDMKKIKSELESSVI